MTASALYMLNTPLFVSRHLRDIAFMHRAKHMGPVCLATHICTTVIGQASSGDKSTCRMPKAQTSRGVDRDQDDTRLGEADIFHTVIITYDLTVIRRDH
jgi:hypothetical protein